MNILVALDSFESAHKKYLIADREKILEVVVEFGLSEEDFTPINAYIFDTNWRSYRHFSDAQRKVFSETPFFNEEQDLQGTIRIHPTMIVAKKNFVGSQDRGLRPYPFHRHHYELSGWIDKDGRSRKDSIRAPEVLCPKLFIRVPVGSECQCGEVHKKG